MARWLAIAVVALSAASASAQPFQAERRWLGSLQDLGTALGERGRLPLAPLSADPERAWIERLGAVLFRAPDLFGETARRAGLSCQLCHPGGGANKRFFVDGVSLKPGTFDGTSALFDPAADDGRFNPIAIPGLGGVALTAPYGHSGRFATLADFARHAIQEEFGGGEPDRLVLDALVAYQERLLPPADPWLDERGRLKSDAPAAARAGEAVFHRPFPGRPELSCAVCHRPDAGFTDRRRHDVGTGLEVDTPSLRRADLMPPFFHDGRFDRLDQVVAYLDGYYRLALSEGERADLVAYLEALRGAGATEPVTLSGDLADIDDLIGVLAEAVGRRAVLVLSPTVGVIRRALGHMHERFLDDDAALAVARERLVELSVGLRAVERRAEEGDWIAAAEQLARSVRRLGESRPVLEAAATRSLYDPDRLRRFLAARSQR